MLLCLENALHTIKIHLPGVQPLLLHACIAAPRDKGVASMGADWPASVCPADHQAHAQGWPVLWQALRMRNAWECLARAEKLTVRRIDDGARSQLRLHLSSMRPVELVVPAQGLSPATRKLLRGMLDNPRVNEQDRDPQFWSPAAAVGRVQQGTQRDLAHLDLTVHLHMSQLPKLSLADVLLDPNDAGQPDTDDMTLHDENKLC